MPKKRKQLINLLCQSCRQSIPLKHAGNIIPTAGACTLGEGGIQELPPPHQKENLKRSSSGATRPALP